VIKESRMMVNADNKDKRKVRR